MSANRLQELMQNLYDAHCEFHKAWARGQTASWKGKEPLQVSSSRDKFWNALNFLFQIKLDPLRNAFSTDSIGAIDEVIDFLAIDVPAFRCGYEKEWYLRRLKSLPLNEAQSRRLKTIALGLCSKPDYRREFSDWAKLMIVLADENFIDKLSELIDAPNEFVRKKAERMMGVIFQNRKDIQPKTVISI